MKTSGIILQKLLALRAGVSRRAATQLIRDQRVRVNGKLAELGMRANPSDQLQFDDQTLIDPDPVMLAYYKPRGVVSTLRDPLPHATLSEVLPGNLPRVVPAGRLDKDSEGLMILTNDGGLIQELTHPKYRHEKEYEVVVRGEVTLRTCETLKKGIHLAEGIARADHCEVQNPKTLRIVLHQGWKRQIRRMLEKMGFDVLILKRIRIGRLLLGRLRSGQLKKIRRSDLF